MWSDALILASPVLALGLGMLVIAWDGKRWKNRTRTAARPQRVQVRTPLPPLPPVLDIHAGRAARRARHGGQR